MPNLLYTTPLTSTCCNILVNPATVIYYNCKKNGYFILLYLELKNTGNIKKIKKYIFKKLKKKRTLKKNSSLKYPINFKRIDLSRLIDRKYFTVLYTVSWNGYRVNTTALINTKTNGFAFINTAYMNDVTKFLNVEATRLEKPI